MIPLPAVPQVIKFTVEGRSADAPWVNVMHYGYTGTAPTTADIIAYCSTLETTWGTEFAPLMRADHTILKARGVDLTSSTSAAGESVATLPGTRTGAALPASAAVVVSKHISRRYRGGHGRSYLAVGTSTDIDDNSNWSTALAVAVEGAYAAVQAAMAGAVQGGTTLTAEVLVSYFDATSVPTPPHKRITPLVEPVTSISVRTHIGTQRRRLGR